ncbi:hypothetical protein ACH4OY_28625 [Micromonospora rubida]|uniref:Uncharacterized protein n=1 Tax=Micromonospora rubida TaxID=2697657 RepID=A0ABW7SSE4_9ACTN
MTARTFGGPDVAIGGSLEQLRHDIGALVDVAARHPSADKRAVLVDTHHQVRLLGQQLNLALRAGAEPVSSEERP